MMENTRKTPTRRAQLLPEQTEHPVPICTAVLATSQLFSAVAHPLSVPLSPELFWRLRTCSEDGNAGGSGGCTLFESKCSSVSAWREDMAGGTDAVRFVEDRSRSCRDAWRDLLPVIADSGSASGWVFTTRLWRDSCARDDGRLLPIWAFLIRVSAVTFFSVEKRLSGRAARAVLSRCSVVREVRLVNEFGRDPDGTALLPMTERLCSPVRLPSSSGRSVGTAGNVSCKEDTLPVPSHVTPFHAQKRVSFSHP